MNDLAACCHALSESVEACFEAVCGNPTGFGRLAGNDQAFLSATYIGDAFRLGMEIPLRVRWAFRSIPKDALVSALDNCESHISMWGGAGPLEHEWVDVCRMKSILRAIRELRPELCKEESYLWLEDTLKLCNYTITSAEADYLGVRVPFWYTESVCEQMSIRDCIAGSRFH